ncbi:MAG: hypothetical protein JWN48_1027 [Myxococcaceae bacterium]|nr:hypothetical protein [Myxococcaceae bacterium]
MMHDAKYLFFGLLVLGGYWYTVRNGIVYGSADQAPSAPSGIGAASRSHPSFWSTGFNGGK